MWFYTYFFIHVGSLRTGADHLFGTEFWCRMKPVVTVANWCKFRKQIWLNCDFLHVHNPGARADKPLGTEFWCRMKAFAMMANWWKFINKISVNCDLVHFFFHDYIPVHSTRAYQPWGLNFYVKLNFFSLWPTGASFIKIILNCDLWFYIQFFLDLIHVHRQGAGADHHRGQSFIVKWKAEFQCQTFCNYDQIVQI